MNFDFYVPMPIMYGIVSVSFAGMVTGIVFLITLLITLLAEWWIRRLFAADVIWKVLDSNRRKGDQQIRDIVYGYLTVTTIAVFLFLLWFI